MRSLKLLRSTYLLLLILPMFLALQGCATAGYENVDTTRKAILVANAEVRAANLLLQDLIQRNVISNNDASNALDSLRDAHTALQTALDALVFNGDPVTAQSALERANISLSLTLTLLSSFTSLLVIKGPRPQPAASPSRD